MHRAFDLDKPADNAPLVADESLQHVDDEVVDLAVPFDEIERFAERAVHAIRGAFGRGDELPYNVCLALRRLLVAAVALILEGVAIVGARSLRLAVAGYPEQNDGAFHRTASGSKRPS